MVITTPKSPSQQSATIPTGPGGQENGNSSNAGTSDTTPNTGFSGFGTFPFGFGRGVFPGFPLGGQQETVSLEGNNNDNTPNFAPFFRHFAPPPPHAHPDPPLVDIPPPLPHMHGGRGHHGPHGPHGPHAPPFYFDPSFGPNLANIFTNHARSFVGDLAHQFGVGPGAPGGPSTRRGPCGPPSPPGVHHQHHRGGMRGGFGWRGGRGGWHGRHNWPGWPAHGPILPRMDIYRTETTYTVTIELPGLKKKDVDISVQDGHLTISGEFVTAPDSENPQQPPEQTPEMDMDQDFEFMGYNVEEVALEDDTDTLKDDDDDEKKKGCFVVRERRYGKFKRTIRLPSWVNVDDIKATMEHGVLKLVFEKPEPENNARKVSIL